MKPLPLRNRDYISRWFFPSTAPDEMGTTKILMCFLLLGAAVLEANPGKPLRLVPELIENKI